MKKLLFLFAVLLTSVGAWADFTKDYSGTTEWIKTGFAVPNGITNIATANWTIGKLEQRVEVTEGTVSVLFDWNGTTSCGLNTLGIELVDPSTYQVVKSHYLKGKDSATDGAPYSITGLTLGSYILRYYAEENGGSDAFSKTGGVINVTGANPLSVVNIDPQKVYRIKAAKCDLYMEIVNFAQTTGEGAFRFKTRSLNMGQYFVFEEGKEDFDYYIKNYNGAYMSAAGWDFYAKEAKPDDAFTIAEAAIDILTFYQDYSKSQSDQTRSFTGYCGNNSATVSDGTFIYNNVGGYSGNNTTWVLEEITGSLIYSELTLLIQEAKSWIDHEYLSDSKNGDLQNAINTAEELSEESSFSDLMSAANNLQVAFDDAVYDIHDVSDLNRLSNDKCYKIHGERGFIYVQDNVLKGSNKRAKTYEANNANHHFAIVEHDSKYYLYSVGAKKFVNKDGNNTSLVALPDHAISISRANVQNTDYDWLITLNDCKINLSDSGAEGVYTNYESEDPGNRWAMYDAGAFNPEEALDAFNKAYLTVSYKLGSKTISSTSIVTKGETYQVSNPYAFTEIVSCTANGNAVTATAGVYSLPISDHTEMIVTLNEVFPYEKTVLNNDGSFPENAAWYVVKQHSNSNETSTWKYEGNGTVTSRKETALKDMSDSHLWCFVGDVWDLKIYNKVAGSGMTLTNTDPATMVTNNSAIWRLVKSNTEGSFTGKNPFCIQKGDNNSYLNNQGTSLKYWHEKDQGSTIMAIADDEILPQIAEAVRTDALSTIATYEEADYFVYSAQAFATAKNAIQSLDLSTLNTASAGISTIREAITTLKSSAKNGAPVAGDYIRFKSRAYGNYLKANDTNLGYTNNAAELTTLWLLEEGNDNNLKIKNVSTNKYIGQVRQSADVPMQEAANAKQFAFTNQDEVYAVFKDVSGDGHAYGHSANGKLVGWEPTAHATQWVISQAFSLTVTYMYNGKELVENKITNLYIDKGETYTIVNPYSSRGYVAIESCSVNGQPLEAVDGVYSFNVTANTTVTVNLVDANLPFVVSAYYQNAVWYYLQLNSAGWGYVSRATTTTDGVASEDAYPTNGASRPADDNGKWAFVGDAINGFKILNKGAGADKYLNSASAEASQASMEATEQLWIVQLGNGGFAIRHKDDANACLNDHGDKLKIWKNSGSPNGTGSAFRVIDADLTILKEQIREKISYSGVGYPSASNQARLNLQNALDQNETTVEELYQLLDAYCQTTDIEMPVSGNAYTFTNVMNDDNQTKRYMKYSSGEKLSVSTSEDDASVFVCHKIRDGVYAFITMDGKILTWFSKDDDGAYKENAVFNGYSTFYATSFEEKSDWNEITISKNGTSADDLGHLRLVGRRKKDGVSSFIIKNADGTFDRAGDSYYFNKDYSSAWILTEVTHTNAEAQNAAIAKIVAKENLKASTKVLGEGLGKYHYVANDAKAYTVNVIDEAETADEVNTVAATLSINLPETGKFYYIQSANTNQYLSNNKSNTLVTTADKTINNIFYFEGEGENSYLVAYENGHYVTNPWNIGVGESKINNNEIYKQTKSFVEGQTGKYALKYFAGGGSTHYFTASGTDTAEKTDKNHAEAQWNLEPVTELPLTIHSSGMSTYSAPVDLTIPDGVTVYYAKRNDGETIRMAPLSDVIPANTGVVVEGAGAVTFPITTGATALESNLLKPVVAAKAVTPEDGNSVFVMATKNGETGFYPLSTTNNVIGGHKSYLEIPSNPAARLSIIWDDTETGIFEVEGGEQNTEIYDLTGRRLDKPTKGVNVVGGKLVIK